MSELSEFIENIQSQRPPVPVDFLLRLMNVDFHNISEIEFETLQDIVVRLRADCIFAFDLSLKDRVNYSIILKKIAESMKYSFEFRKNNLVAQEFFDKFIEAVNDLC